MGRRRTPAPPAFVSAGLLQQHQQHQHQQQSPDSGFLAIGGITITRAPLGRRPPAGTSPPPQQRQQGPERRSSAEEGLDEELQDYLDNVARSDDADSDDGDGPADDAADAAARRSRGLHQQRLQAFAALDLEDGLEGPLQQDMARCGDDARSSSGSSGSSSSSSSSSGSDGDAGVVVEGPQAAAGGLRALSLEGGQHPVQTAGGRGTPAGAACSGGRGRGGRGRFRPAPSTIPRASAAATAAACVSRVTGVPASALLASCPDVAAAAKPPHPRAAALGAKGGQLAPGEKGRLDKEAKAARRAAREDRRGFDALRLLEQLEEFVAQETDMISLDPMGGYGKGVAGRMAKCFGIAVGGGSVRKGTRMTLTRTPRTATPQGEAAEWLTQVLAKHLVHLAGPEVPPRPAAAAAAARRHSGSRAGEGAGAGGGGSSRQGSRTVGSGALLYQQPVAFVSSGLLDPNAAAEEREREREQHQQQQQRHDAAPGATRLVIGAMSVAAAAADAAAAGSEDAAAAGSPRTAVRYDVLPVLLGARGLPRRGSAEEGLLGVGAAEPEPRPYHWHRRQTDHQHPQQQQQQQPAEDGTSSPVGGGGGRGLGWAVPRGPGASSWGGAPPAADAAAPRGGEARGAVDCGGGEDDDEDEDGDDDDDDDKEGKEEEDAGEEAEGEEEEEDGAGRGLGWTGLGGRSGLGRAAATATASDAGSAEPATAAAAAAAAAAAGAAAPPGLPLPRGGPALNPGGFGVTSRDLKAASRKQRKAQRRADRAQQRLAPHQGDGAGGLGWAEAEQEAAGGPAGFACFEQHGTGVGSRLMRRMGWSEGQGLGRDQQGRATPLTAMARPKNLGLGA